MAHRAKMPAGSYRELYHNTRKSLAEVKATLGHSEWQLEATTSVVTQLHKEIEALRGCIKALEQERDAQKEVKYEALRRGNTLEASNQTTQGKHRRLVEALRSIVEAL